MATERRFLNIQTGYEIYKKKTKPENQVSLKEFKEINTLFIKFLMDKVFDGEEVALPLNMGTLSIKGKKQKIRFDENGKVVGLAPDWKKTKLLREINPEAKENRTIIYHTNEHSDGIRYKYHWSKQRVNVKNKSLYALRMTRTNKRAVYNLIKEGKEYVTQIQKK